MNPLQPKSNGSPALKLARRVSYVTDTVAPEPASGELAGEFEALREREANLRAYETKLRAWQEQLDAAARAPGFVPPPTSASLTRSPFAGSRSPFGSGSEQEIQDAWEKFHRARALLQAEQNQLRDERMTFRDREADLQRREAELQAREAAVLEREQQLEVAAARAAEASEKTPSAVRRLTQAPFLAARSVFGASR